MKATVIIPYKEDRGWLECAIDSVPADVQLLVSKGDGTWPENFNKALPQAKGEFIKYLHDDDMLTENCIDNSIATFQMTGCDFLHGNAIQIRGDEKLHYIPQRTHPTVRDLAKRNTVHSATLMYHRSVFDRVGSFDEELLTCEEYEFTLRCLARGLKIGYCDKFLAYYRLHPRQKTNTIKETRRRVDRQLIRSMYDNF